jgi:hypothetical protein
MIQLLISVRSDSIRVEASGEALGDVAHRNFDDLEVEGVLAVEVDHDQRGSDSRRPGVALLKRRKTAMETDLDQLALHGIGF